ncbi:MAG: hypothetical protein RBS75_03835 [Methylophilaceae bacterium]|nr:hypothetical protein [Methylophilaceae bacterium]
MTGVLAASLSGCVTDPATRLAYDIEHGASRLAQTEGARHRVEHRTPSKAGQCEGPYSVQLDKVGALVIWCKDASGATVSSHSTSYQSRFIVTPQTWIVEKPAGSTLTIALERRDGRAVVVEVD